MTQQIMDINCMLGHWPSRKLRFHDVDGLLTEMDSYRITRCVAYHSDAHWDLARGNDQMWKAAQHPSGRIRHAYILRPAPDSAKLPEGPALLEKLRQEKPVAIRLFPTMHRFLADSFYCGELLDVLNELAMPVIFDPDQRPAYGELPKLAREFPRIKFILLRQSLNEGKFTLPLLQKTENIFFDTSTMVDAGFIDEIVNKYGSRRLLFGSGQPFYVPAGALAMIIYARIPDRDKENIFWNNWQELERTISWT